MCISGVHLAAHVLLPWDFEDPKCDFGERVMAPQPCTYTRGAALLMTALSFVSALSRLQDKQLDLF